MSIHHLARRSMRWNCVKCTIADTPLTSKRRVYGTTSMPSIGHRSTGNTTRCNETANFVVSILGPPNAGKSTLFNRMMDKKEDKCYRLDSDANPRHKRNRGRLGVNHPSTREGGAIVSKTSGTTRDRRQCIGRIGGTTFDLVDTAGVDGVRIGLLKSQIQSLERCMIEQTMEAAKQSDLILLMFDARIGVTTDLADIVQWLRNHGFKAARTLGTPNQIVVDHSTTMGTVVILANKCEGDAWTNYYQDTSHVLDHLTEVSCSGFGEAIPISAEQGDGLADIAVIIETLMTEKQHRMGVSQLHLDGQDQDEGIPSEKPLQLAILGRQNVGKSTLVNALLQQTRVISGEKPGLTRDAITINWKWQDKPVRIVDTAGLRRMAKRDHSDDIEDFAVRDAMRAMKIADVAVLVLDAGARMLQKQELAISEAVVKEGRALVVVANKMDIVVDSEYTQEEYAHAVKDHIEQRFPMLRQTPVVAMSSLTGESVEELMPVVFNARERWSQIISTKLLNRWLADVQRNQTAPLKNGQTVRIKYIMQTKGRPPTFLLFCNVSKLPASYMNYLVKKFQDSFQMFGMEVRISIKKSSTNPYVKKPGNTTCITVRSNTSRTRLRGNVHDRGTKRNHSMKRKMTSIAKQVLI